MIKQILIGVGGFVILAWGVISTIYIFSLRYNEYGIPPRGFLGKVGYFDAYGIVLLPFVAILIGLYIVKYAYKKYKAYRLR